MLSGGAGVLEGETVAVRGRSYLDGLAGRRVVVVGLARSGVAAAQLCRVAGASVVAVDAKPLERLGPDAQALTALGIRVVLEADAAPDVVRADLVVVSPGVAVDAPLPRAARAAGVRVIGELELGWRAVQAETIAITGTNGKTTTTALTGALLARQARPVVVAGNIGTPLAAHALDVPADGLVVVEVSSFQLETIETFHPRVAAVLNVTPDHLDRHGSLVAYAEAKARIFMNQTPADRAVVNADDPGARALAARTRADVVWFSRLRDLDHGVFVRDGVIVANLDGRVAEVGPVAEIALRGSHNVENVLAAVACALVTGVGRDEIRRGVAAFRAVAHRIEFVRALGGVGYYNDSKATNVDSTIKALASFPERLVLIAGGKGKGQDFAPLAEAARGRVTSVVVIGEDGPKIGAVLARAGIAVTPAASLAEAIAAARGLASPGDVVLLSPACASFDMFDNFEHRGETFKRLVLALPG
jgi:UDP-N-acetylmuramoylalanine--D-glutamate ligase